MSYWYPVDAHPEAGAKRPWFQGIEPGLLYAAEGHPLGRSTVPWFREIDGYVYPMAHSIVGGGDEAWFEIRGSFAYPTPANPAWPTYAPLYQLRPS
jgi:hypothetical protein